MSNSFRKGMRTRFQSSCAYCWDIRVDVAAFEGGPCKGKRLSFCRRLSLEFDTQLCLPRRRCTWIAWNFSWWIGCTFSLLYEGPMIYPCDSNSFDLILTGYMLRDQRPYRSARIEVVKSLHVIEETCVCSCPRGRYFFII
jgi:hypothetical protein